MGGQIRQIFSNQMWYCYMYLNLSEYVINWPNLNIIFSTYYVKFGKLKIKLEDFFIPQKSRRKKFYVCANFSMLLIFLLFKLNFLSIF